MKRTDRKRPCVDLGPYVIMPNHIDALIGIDNPVGNGRDRSLQAQVPVRAGWGVQDDVIEGDSPGRARPVSLAEIVP